MSVSIQRRTFLMGTTAFTAAASTRSYRAAVIGHTGRGNYGHDWDTAFRGYPNIEVVAVADPDKAGRSRARVSSGAAREYEDYREMLRKEKPDLVAICPRTLDQRLPMFTAVVEAGAHILMEKPLARDLIEADAMVALAERHKRKVQVGHTARPTPVTIRARNILRDGAIGKFLEMRARGKEDRRAGGEDMMVLGTHLFDLMRFFAGDPRWCFAHVTAAGAEMEQRHAREATEPLGPVAGDEIAAMYYFESGVHGYFGSRPSGANTGDRFGITLLGSKGAIFVPTTTVPGS
jgi:predicted dehydrogenase